MFDSRLGPQAHGHIKGVSHTITVTFGAHPCIRASTFHHIWPCCKAFKRQGFLFFSDILKTCTPFEVLPAAPYLNSFLGHYVDSKTSTTFWSGSFFPLPSVVEVFVCLECRCAVSMFTWHNEHLFDIKDFFPDLPSLGMRTPLFSP